MRVVCVHGIGKQMDGEQTLLSQWLPALQDGVTRAGATGLLADAEVGMAFYGDLFRPPGQPLAVGDPSRLCLTEIGLLRPGPQGRRPAAWSGSPRAPHQASARDPQENSSDVLRPV